VLQELRHGRKASDVWPRSDERSSVYQSAEKMCSYAAKMSESARQIIQKLRGTWHRVSVSIGIGSDSVVLVHLPHPTYLGVDLDRTDNERHYEPGNIRLVSRQENLHNTRRNSFTTYKSKRVPRQHAYHVLRALWPDVMYTDGVVQNLVSRG